VADHDRRKGLVMEERSRRKVRVGVVVSDARDKTVTVEVPSSFKHPRYDKVVRRSTKFHAHDEANDASIGDTVRIMEIRPVSKQKRWRVVEIVERAR
jgi:small subunit ribosomal protein S17